MFNPYHQIGAVKLYDLNASRYRCEVASHLSMFKRNSAYNESGEDSHKSGKSTEGGLARVSAEVEVWTGRSVGEVRVEDLLRSLQAVLAAHYEAGQHSVI